MGSPAGTIKQAMTNPNRLNKKRIISVNLIIISLIVFFNSCCPFVKADDLGHGFVLSEYDHGDRRILYSKDKCSGTGIEVVPMSVLEYASNSRWIIARSSKFRDTTNFQYWIIDKDFDIPQNDDSTVNSIKSYVSGPLDSATFTSRLDEQQINLKLKKF